MKRSESIKISGIIAKMDALVKDLDKEMTEVELTEKDTQGDSEATMKDSRRSALKIPRQ